MKDDFSDIRFSDYARTLPYWIESSTSRTSATVWVKLTETGEAAREFYLYYGNGAAASESDGDDVFDFFDDFTGDAVDATKWTSSGTPTVSGSLLTLNGAESIYTASTFGVNVILEMYIKPTHTAIADYNWQAGFSEMAGNDCVAFWGRQGSVANKHSISRTTTGSFSFLNFVSTYTNAAFYRYTLRRISTTSISGTIDAETRSTSSVIPTTSQNLRLLTNNAAETIICDWIFIRKYAATEPTCTIVESGVNPAIPIYPILKLLTTGEATETLTINGSYSVLTAATKTVGGSYSLVSSSTKTVDGAYSVATSTTKTVDGAYSVVAPTTKTLDGSYSILTSSTKTLDGTYHIIGQQTHNISGSYSVLVASTKQIAGSYKVSTTHTLGPERVTNGDFETGDITGWAIEGEVYYYNVSDWDDIEEQDWGGYILGIQRDESDEGYGGISQTIDLTNVSKLTFDFESYNSASHNLYIYIKIGDSELIPVLYEGDDNGSTYEEWLTHAEVDVSSYTGEQKVSFLVEDCPPGTYNSLYLNNISAIPSGITGTYSVTASGSNLISGDYKVSTLSAKTLGGTYFLGSSGQADIDGTYHVLTTGDTGINGEYHVSCSTTKQVSGSYSVVLSPAATEVSGDYAVSITITKQASGSYSIISSSTKQVAGSYSVLTTGTKQIAGTYDIGGAGVTLIPGTYTVVTTSTKTISGDYLVTTLHTTTIDGDYSVYSASTYTKTVDGQYSVITPVTKTVSGDYSVSLSSTKLILGQYKASTLYTKTIDGTYTVTPSYTTTISGTYSIISSPTTTLDGTYTIPVDTTTVKIDGTYSVKYRVYRSKIVKTRAGYGSVSHIFQSYFKYLIG